MLEVDNRENGEDSAGSLNIFVAVSFPVTGVKYLTQFKGGEA